ncbi:MULTISPECIES: FtsX-like permease family protein [unclassified Streptomyces]|uniref:FtsX-like permease family protein n=1 Tax=unclassified Streptomyces TaxID=2593676 RepID=UPI001CB73451|nr:MULTISPECIES: FtsX-like permease family protein [unclassified Streptomyces]
MALGSALGVACLAAVLTIPTILAAHDARTTNRAVYPGDNKNVVYQEFLDPYGSQPLRRVFFGHTGTGPAPVPPGIDELPRKGEAVVSPRLAALLAANPRAAGLVPGRVTGTIAPAGLGGPDELYAYIGTDPAALPEARELGHFGAESVRDELIDPSTLDILRFTLGCIVLLPLVIFLSVCARLSGESRARRLAALRLVGLSAKDTLRVNAGESVAAAFAGAVAGIVGYLGVNEVMARVGLPGLHWYPADGRPEGTTLVVCLLGCPALAWFVGQFSARRAASSPISVRRTGERRTPRKFGTLLLVPGLGIIAGYCALSVMGRDPSGGSASSVLVPGAVLLTGAGLVFGLAPITAWLARRVARVTKSLPVALAMRRTEVDPGSSLRVVTGLVLLVFGASLTQGVLVELDQVSRPTNPVQEYSLPLRQLSTQQRSEVSEAAGVQSHVMASPTWYVSGTDAPRTYGLVATCQQLADFVERTEGCVEHKVMRIQDEEFSIDEDATPGRTFPFLLSAGRHLQVTVPQETVTVRAYQPSEFAGPSLLIPPSLLPPGSVLAEGNLVLLSDADPATIRSVLDAIGSIAPTASVQPVGIVIDSLAQLTVIRSLLAVGMVLGLVIGVAAFVVSVADRALERRRQVAALVLLGARAGTLRVVQVVQVLLPLVVGLGGAVVAGWLAESSYLITGGGAVHWDWEGLPLLLLCVLGVLLAAAVASLPMVRRHVDPEHIRRD